MVERKIIRNNVSVDQEVGGVLQKGDMTLEERYKIRSGYNQEWSDKRRAESKEQCPKALCEKTLKARKTLSHVFHFFSSVRLSHE